MSFKHLKTISHKAFAAFLAVWLSGVVFLFCCDEINGKPTEAEFCPLAKVPARCDKAAPENSFATFAESTGETAIDCCGFLPAVFDKARKIERTQKQIAVTPKLAVVKFRLPRLINNSPPITAFYTRLPDRQTTFVKNCVFRI